MPPTTNADAFVSTIEPGASQIDERSAIQLMLRVVSFAESIGLLPKWREPGASLDTFRSALQALARLDVGRHVRLLDGPVSAHELASVASAALDAINDSPVPSAEWEPMFAIFGEELAPLLAISPSSIARYRSGERPTPDPVAARLHVIALLVADLAGSYNGFGIRRWMRRPRTQLGGRSPVQLLTGGWSPEDPGVLQTRALARALIGHTLG